MVAPKPRRCWFRFSLRTLLIVVSLVCAWVAYQVNWIRERHDFLEKQKAFLRCVEPTGPVRSAADAIGTAPWSMWLFGEKTLNVVPIFFMAPLDRMPTTEEQREIELARKLFPEADMLWLIEVKKRQERDKPERVLYSPVGGSLNVLKMLG